MSDLMKRVEQDEDPTHTMGYDFERYVLGLLGKEFRVVSWMQDGPHTREEIDFNPDIVVEHIKTGDMIGIECKFRSSRFNGLISWAKEYQLSKYYRYRENTRNPLFIVIGLGGKPDDPECMYCIPLWQASHNILNTLPLKRYRRNPRRKFVWNKATGELK